MQPTASLRLRRYGQVLYGYSALYFGLGLLATLCLAWTMLAIPLHALTPAGSSRRLGRGVIHHGFRFYLRVLEWIGACRFDLSALDGLLGERALILAPNHPSLLDAPLILSRLPDVACIMKADLVNNPLFGAGARLAGFIPNDSGHGMIRDAVAELHRGGHLLLFPEGTRSTRRPVNPFKGSTALIAKHAGASVQTVLIEIDAPFLGKHWPLWRRPELPIVGRLRLGRRFPPPADTRAFTAELERYFAEALAAADRVEDRP